MSAAIPKGTLPPPPGRPSWGGGEDLPLIYLGWGQRDFCRDPLAMHYDLGTNYYLILNGEVVVTSGETARKIHGPTALFFDPGCAFGISQSTRSPVEILVWIWQGIPVLQELRPAPGGFFAMPLRPGAIPPLKGLHVRCRDEVALADSHLPRNLVALRELLEVEILRGNHSAPAEHEMRWKLARAWMAGNLVIHAPVPALCDYLRMSPSTLHRFSAHGPGCRPGPFSAR